MRCGVILTSCASCMVHSTVPATSLYINTTVYRDILHCIGVCQWWQPSQCLEEETRGNQSSLADEAGLRAADCKGNVLLSQQTGSWVNCKCEWF